MKVTACTVCCVDVLQSAARDSSVPTFPPDGVTVCHRYETVNVPVIFKIKFFIKGTLDISDFTFYRYDIRKCAEKRNEITRLMLTVSVDIIISLIIKITTVVSGW